MNQPLKALLANSIYEIIPMKNTAEKALGIPKGSTVSVTASPTKGMIATVELAEHMAANGYLVIPHISARLVKSTQELQMIVDRVTAAGATSVFIVGGDADDPGEFFDAASLIRRLNQIGHPFTKIGITGYPEGHPSITDDALMAALVEKAPAADYIATQMCFDTGAIARWAGKVRARGVALPLYVGIPGASETSRLMTIGARIGVGTSLKYLARNRKAITKLIRPGLFTPDELVTELAELDVGIGGFHIFTFNQIDDTVEWVDKVTRAI